METAVTDNKTRMTFRPSIFIAGLAAVTAPRVRLTGDVLEALCNARNNTSEQGKTKSRMQQYWCHWKLTQRWESLRLVVKVVYFFLVTGCQTIRGLLAAFQTFCFPFESTETQLPEGGWGQTAAQTFLWRKGPDPANLLHWGAVQFQCQDTDLITVVSSYWPGREKLPCCSTALCLHDLYVAWHS